MPCISCRKTSYPSYGFEPRKCHHTSRTKSSSSRWKAIRTTSLLGAAISSGTVIENFKPLHNSTFQTKVHSIDTNFRPDIYINRGFSNVSLVASTVLKWIDSERLQVQQLMGHGNGTMKRAIVRNKLSSFLNDTYAFL